VAIALAIAGGEAVATQNAFPAKLVGTWTRTVTAADVKRAGSWGVPAGSVWTLTIKKSGASSAIREGDSEPFTGPIIPVGPTRVRINVGLVFPNVYS
jgi:hypothetical protein